MPKTLTIRINEDLHKEFKRYVLEHDTDMSSVLIAYIEQLVNHKSSGQ